MTKSHMGSAYNLCVKERAALRAGHVKFSVVRLIMLLLAVVLGMRATV